MDAQGFAETGVKGEVDGWYSISNLLIEGRLFTNENMSCMLTGAVSKRRFFEHPKQMLDVKCSYFSSKIGCGLSRTC